MQPTTPGLGLTPARRRFKLHGGSNNHFLITALIGLDAVRDGKAVLSPEFSTSWEPHNPEQSSLRSRAYVLSTSLVWITELVSAYRKALLNTPGLSLGISNPGDAGSAKKLNELAKSLNLGGNPSLLLVQLGMEWRNIVVHTDRTSVPGTLRGALLPNRAHYLKAHRGLDISRTIERAEAGESPTFKDIASIIAAAQDLISQIDERAIDKLDLEQYADSILRRYLSNSSDQALTLVKLWPGSTDRTEKRLVSILINGGMRTDPISKNRVSQQYLTTTSELSVREAREKFLDSEA